MTSRHPDSQITFFMSVIKTGISKHVWKMDPSDEQYKMPLAFPPLQPVQTLKWSQGPCTFQQIIVVAINVVGLLLSDPPILASLRHTPEIDPEPEVFMFQVHHQFQMAPMSGRPQGKPRVSGIWLEARSFSLSVWAVIPSWPKGRCKTEFVSKAPRLPGSEMRVSPKRLVLSRGVDWECLMEWYSLIQSVISTEVRQF